MGSATRGLWAAQQGTRKHQEVASESFSAGNMTNHHKAQENNTGTMAQWPYPGGVLFKERVAPPSTTQCEK